MAKPFPPIKIYHRLKQLKTTQLEIDAAKERLKIENELLALRQQKREIDLKIEGLEMSLEQIRDDPDRYFTIKAEMKAYFG